MIVYHPFAEEGNIFIVNTSKGNPKFRPLRFFFSLILNLMPKKHQNRKEEKIGKP